MWCPSNLTYRVIYMSPKILPAGVTVKKRRKYLGWQGNRNKKRILLKPCKYQVTHLHRGRMIFGQLHVVLRTAGLVAGGNAAVDPIGLIKQCAAIGNLSGGQYVWNLNEHGYSFCAPALALRRLKPELFTRN